MTDYRRQTMTVGELIRALKARVDSGQNDPEDQAVVVDLDGDKRPIVGVSGDEEVWIEWDEWEEHE
jgi:hypothetical protein